MSTVATKGSALNPVTPAHALEVSRALGKQGRVCLLRWSDFYRDDWSA